MKYPLPLQFLCWNPTPKYGIKKWIERWLWNKDRIHQYYQHFYKKPWICPTLDILLPLDSTEKIDSHEAEIMSSENITYVSTLSLEVLACWAWEIHFLSNKPTSLLHFLITVWSNWGSASRSFLLLWDHQTIFMSFPCEGLVHVSQSLGAECFQGLCRLLMETNSNN